MRASRLAVTHVRFRSAFTLLETMLALSLSALLLAAIYAAIDQSWRTAASGREEMERAQLARALIHKIEVDIRSMTFVPPPPVEETEDESTTSTSGSSGTATGGSSGTGGTGGGTGSGGGSGGGGTGGGSGGTGSNRGTGGTGGSGTGGGITGGTSGGGRTGGSGVSGGTGTAKSSGSSGSGANSSSSSGASFGGLAGTNTSATGTTSTTDTTETTEETGPNSRSMGIRGTSQKFEISISRPRRDLLPGTTASSSRTSDLRQVSYSFTTTGASPSGGLVRSEGDRMAVETLEANGGMGTQVSSTQMLAPEVSAFRVRYFDGRVWSESWDTDSMGRIPRAVEISIGFAPPKRKPPIFSAPVSRSMDSFRTVILIPVSDPYPQDFVQ